MKTLTFSQLNQVSAGSTLENYLQQEVELANWSVFGTGGRDHRGEAIFNRFSYHQAGLLRDSTVAIVR